MVARNARDGATTSIELDGESFDFEPEAFLLDAKSPEGFAAVEEEGYLAAFDTRLTPELLREGMARDLVRLVQNARKNAGLEVSDRIELGLAAGGELQQAAQEHLERLQSEVLAQRVSFTELGDGAHREA